MLAFDAIMAYNSSYAMSTAAMYRYRIPLYARRLDYQLGHTAIHRILLHIFLRFNLVNITDDLSDF